MTKVTAQMSVSLDGCYAGPRDDTATDWLTSPEAAPFFRVTRWAVDAHAWRDRQGIAGGEHSTNSDVIAEMFTNTGAYVIGRRMADGGEIPWGEEPPFQAPVFVVTNRPRQPLVRTGTTFTYVTEGLESAITQAKAAAGGKNVMVEGGGSTIRQAIAAGLVDELELHIVPVLIGGGERLLTSDLALPSGQAIELVPTRVLHTPEVTHIRYTITGRAALTLDARGRE